MAKLVFGMMQSLDGYVDHLELWARAVFLDADRCDSAVRRQRGMAFYEGLQRLLQPGHLKAAFWACIVIGAAAVFESMSFVVARREIRRRGTTGSLWRRVRRSKDPFVEA